MSYVTLLVTCISYTHHYLTSKQGNEEDPEEEEEDQEEQKMEDTQKKQIIVEKEGENPEGKALISEKAEEKTSEIDQRVQELNKLLRKSGIEQYATVTRARLGYLDADHKREIEKDIEKLKVDLEYEQTTKKLELKIQEIEQLLEEYYEFIQKPQI